MGDKPLAIDLFCGLGGWAEGFLVEGYRVIGFDIERWPYPGQLVIQDVLTLNGSQFRDATVIVASPPCQEYSYMAMPWSCGKAIAAEYHSGARDVKKLTELFDACFRIQREASEATGRKIPLIVENVRGAQKWVGRAKWHYGSYYLWGDVPALMPMVSKAAKVPGFRFDGSGGSFQSASVEHTGHKSQGLNWSDRTLCGQKNSVDDGVKFGGGWWHDTENNLIRKVSFRSSKRKGASALIAKIPFPLAQHIARVFKNGSSTELELEKIK